MFILEIDNIYHKKINMYISTFYNIHVQMFIFFFVKIYTQKWLRKLYWPAGIRV